VAVWNGLVWKRISGRGGKLEARQPGAPGGPADRLRHQAQVQESRGRPCCTLRA